MKSFLNFIEFLFGVFYRLRGVSGLGAGGVDFRRDYLFADGVCPGALDGSINSLIFGVCSLLDGFVRLHRAIIYRFIKLLCFAAGLDRENRQNQGGEDDNHNYPVVFFDECFNRFHKIYC